MHVPKGWSGRGGGGAAAMSTPEVIAPGLNDSKLNIIS